MESKAELRAAMREALRGMTPGARATASAEICRRIRKLPDWAASRVVALYAPLEMEVDLTGLLGEPGKVYCFPRVHGRELEFHRCDPAELKAGRWNLREPDAALHEAVQPGEIDLILTPGLAFTAAGERLGRGGGYYDRFLPRVRGTRIGVCFQLQLVAAVPGESHDCEVAAVVSA